MNLWFLFPTTIGHFIIYGILSLIIIGILKKFKIIGFDKEKKE